MRKKTILYIQETEWRLQIKYIKSKTTINEFKIKMTIQTKV
jgi:hypothetical protein